MTLIDSVAEKIKTKKDVKILQNTRKFIVISTCNKFKVHAAINYANIIAYLDDPMNLRMLIQSNAIGK